MKENAVLTKKITKTALANTLGISRQSLYYPKQQPLLDEEVKRQIEAVLSENPAYGHKRIALELKLNKKRIRRVMKQVGIKPYRPHARALRTKGDQGKPALNAPSIYTTCFALSGRRGSGSLILRTLNTEANLSIWPLLWIGIRER